MFIERVFAFENRLQVVSQLKETLTSRNIGSVALDLDDSLIDTKAIFKTAIHDTCGLILYGHEWLHATVSMQEAALALRDTYTEVLKALRPEYGVKPAIMYLATDITAKISGHKANSPHYQAAMQRTEAIYETDLVKPFEYAHETIEMLRSTGLPLLLVTHAEPNWTYRKLARSGLYQAFNRVICIPVDEVKADQWVPRLQQIGVELTSTIVVGDNLYADILPTVKEGAFAVWINNRAIDHTPHPGIFLSEQLFRSQVIEVSHIKEVVPTLINR